MAAAGQKFQKLGIPVRLGMSEKELLLGLIFVRQDQRVIDVLCDGRAFIPLKTRAGFKLVNKQHIIQIDLVTPEELQNHSNQFPEVDPRHLQGKM